MLNHFFFFVGLSLLLTHEMDAVRLAEWRLFLFLSKMREEQAYTVFTALHIPLYVLLFWGLTQNSDGGINQNLVIGIDAFCVIHVFLHMLFIRHKEYQFHSVFSKLLIIGAGIAGGADIVLYLL